MNSPVGVIVAALIVGIALVVAGFLVGGRYSVTVIQDPNATRQHIIYEVDRFTRCDHQLPPV